jgi:streptomycin 6-kinase
MLDPNFVLDDDTRDRLIARFGAGVDAWCTALPAMVERYCLRWHLELDQALAGNTSRVFIGRQLSDGSRNVVLKLTPDRAIANEEAIALRAWSATPHVVDLLNADLEAGVLLLERIEPGTKASDEPELPSVSEFADLLAGLRKAAGYEQLPTLAQGLESMFSRIGDLLSNPRVSSLVTPQVLATGHRKARELASDGPVGLLHGDLHLSNILRAGPPRGLVAIDPRPSVGDPTFDALDWTLDRATSTDEVRDRIDQLAQLVPDLDRDRLWRWSHAIAPVLAVLHLRRHPPDDSTQLFLKLAANS